MKKILVFAFILVFAVHSSGQTLVNRDWIMTGGSPSAMFDFQASCTDASHNLIVVGNTFHSGQQENMLIRKYNSSGVLQFQREYDGTLSGIDFATNVTTIGTAIFVTGFEGDTVTGVSQMVTMELNSSGTIVWTAKYSGSYSGYNIGTRIITNGSNKIFVCGTSQTGTADFAAVTIMYNTSGVQQFVNKYDSVGLYDGGVDMALGTGSTLVTTYGVSGLSTSSGDFVVQNINTSGVTSGVKRVNNPSSYIAKPIAIVRDQNQNVFFSGVVETSPNNEDIKVVKLDSLLNLRWAKTYGGSANGNDEVTAMKIDLNGNPVLTGFQANPDTSKSVWTLRLKDSVIVMNVKYDCPISGNDAKGASLDLDSMGHIYATGKVFNGHGYSDITLSYDTFSNQRWAAIFASNDSSNDQGQNISVDSGYVYVNGKSTSGDSTTYHTLKYEQWQKLACVGDECPTITYRIKNSHVTVSGVDSFAEFDIYASQSINGIPYYNGYIGLTYSKNIFGSNAVDSGRVVVSRGTVTTNTNYTLAVVDTLFKSDAIPVNGDEIWLSISRSNTSGLYDMADTPQQLCHMKMKMKAGSRGNCQIGFDQYFMEPKSAFYSSAANPYTFVYTAGRVGSLRSDVINGQIANISHTNSYPEYITFDIQAQSSAGDPFYDADIIIAYNTDNFGFNVASSGSLTCSQSASSDVNSSLYDLGSPSNNGSDQFEITVSANGNYDAGYDYGDPPPSIPTISSYTTLAVCSLKVENCCYNAVSGAYRNMTSISGDYVTVSFDDDGGSSDPADWSYDQDSPSGYGIGGNLLPSGGYSNGSSSICPSGASPSIANGGLSPTTISAGTFSVLTITGSGFGCTPGQVFFPNSSLGGGANMMHTQAPDIQSWQDNEIKVWVPSTQDFMDGYAAGSGAIVVQTSTGTNSAPSSDLLTIPYAALNIRYSATDYRPVYVGLKSIDASGGYTFIPDNLTIPSSPNSLPPISAAMSDWVCETGIKLTMGAGANITGGASPVDHQNTITYGTTDAGAAAQTMVSCGSVCTNSNSELIAAALDIDMVFSNTLTYDLTTFAGTNNTGANTSGLYSLLSVARHEFGHVGLLREVLNSADLMYYSEAPGANAQTIQNDDQNGVIYILTDVGPNHTSPCFTYSAQHFVSPCPTLAIHNGINVIGENPFNVLVYPNPFSQDITIGASISEQGEMKVAIFDVLGQVVSEVNFGSQSGEISKTIDASSLSVGAYVVQVTIGSFASKIKLIKSDK